MMIVMMAGVETLYVGDPMTAMHCCCADCRFLQLNGSSFLMLLLMRLMMAD